MSFAHYPRYKESGVEWLPTVPEGWNIGRVRGLFDIKKRIAGTLGLDVFSITQQGFRVKDLESNKGQQSMDYSKYQLVEVGDFAMNHMDLITGGVDIAEYRGVTSPDYRVISIRDRTVCHDRYFLYLFRLCIQARIFYAYGQGSSQLGRWRLATDQFRDFRVPVPPRREQEAIAAFLDRETAKIDALVAEQERLIELLREKLKAIVSHAVTKGLNPHAPMKASGIDWLGEVPAHWTIGPVKRFFSSLDGRRIPLSTEERSHRQGEYPYYGASGIIDAVDGFIFDEDLVLVSEDGANLVNRATPIAFVATGKYWVNNHAHILKPTDDNLQYWAERIEAVDLAPYVSGSAQPKLTAEALLNLPIAVPPDKAERAAIQSSFLNQTAKIDGLIGVCRHAVSLLQERRTALISAAVTGKIDVRGLAKPEAA